MEAPRALDDISLFPDPASPVPLSRQLLQRLRQAIRSGALAEGSRLLPTREFAARLGVSRNTVVAAMDQLISEGYLVARVGSGTFVARGVGAAAVPARPRAARASAAGSALSRDRRQPAQLRRQAAAVPHGRAGHRGLSRGRLGRFRTASAPSPPALFLQQPGWPQAPAHRARGSLAPVSRAHRQRGRHRHRRGRASRHRAGRERPARPRRSGAAGRFLLPGGSHRVRRARRVGHHDAHRRERPGCARRARGPVRRS